MGELENGYVKRFERGDMIIDLNGKTEGIIPRHHQFARRALLAGRPHQGRHRRRAHPAEGTAVVLSRTDPRLLIKLFEMEVPEIYDGTVVIKGAVREPGERAKIAVMSRERDVDPVGACVGMKGSRVQSIIRELRGEKIDIIPGATTSSPTRRMPWLRPRSHASASQRRARRIVRTSTSSSTMTSSRWPSASAA